MDRPVVALVLAGGVGTRLYPAAGPDRPKQFLDPTDAGRSLLEATLARADFADHVAVATRERHADAVRARVADAGVDATVLVEPAARDSGPALVHATARLRERHGDPVVVALPSDHAVGDDAAFRETATEAAGVAARTGRLVTVGVEPTRPETGYGYLEPGAERDGYRLLDAFHEKPDAATARRYLAGEHLWNAGIFAWTAEAFLAAAHDSPLEPLVAAADRGEPGDPAAFEAVPAVSVDHAVMERAAADGRVAVVPAAFPWDDLGTWDAVGRAAEPVDDDGNVVVGGAAATLVDATETVVAGDGGHVSVVGVDGLAVVTAGDRVLVVPRAAAGRVREVVARLRADGTFDDADATDG